MLRRLSGGKPSSSLSKTSSSSPKDSSLDDTFQKVTFKKAMNLLKLIVQRLDKNKIDPDAIFGDCGKQLNIINETVNVLLSGMKNKCPPQAFISHYKAQAGTSAQLLKSRLEKSVDGLKCFLDSDNLENLNLLPCHVLMSSIFYLIMSPKTDQFKFGPFNRPYCLVEILTWYLNKEKMKCVVVFQKQDGVPMTTFPSSQQETNELIPSWDVVQNAIGRRDVCELVWKAIQEMKQQVLSLEWNPTCSDEKQSQLQLQKILESTGMPLKSNEKEEEQVEVKNSNNVLKANIICCLESENEAVLLRDRTKVEFEDQIEIEVNKDLDVTFSIVLLTPGLLNDKNGLEMVALAVKKKCNLIPITISRIGLDAFDFQKQAIIHQDAFKMLIQGLAKPLSPHSSSEQLTVQLNSIWSVLGLTNSKSQFAMIPFVADPFEVAIKKAQLFAPGTREWMFKQVVDVVKRNDNPVFVIVGTAGLGKSVIQAELCRRYCPMIGRRFQTLSENGDLEIVALHFFKHDNQVLNEAKSAIGSIARQLASSIDGFRHHLEESLKTNNPDELKNLQVLFRKSILEPALKLELKQDKRLVIVLDALDECEDRHELIPLLSKIWPEMPKCFGLIMTTRPDVEIPPLDKFSPFVLQPNDEENRKDIELFIKWKLKSNATNVVLDTLCRNANGMFLYAMFACEQLQSCASPNETEVQAAKLPVSMDEVYVDYFSTLQDSYKEFPILYVGSLAPILASRVPLPELVWKEACLQALSNHFPKRDGSKLMDYQVSLEFETRVKQPLVRLLDFGGGTVAVLHKSMDDFLRMSASSKTPAHLQIPVAIGHELISKVDIQTENKSAEHFISAHCIYHLVEANNIPQAVKWVLDIDKVMKSIYASKMDSNFERLLDDVELLLGSKQLSEENISLIKYLHSLLQLSKKAIMNDPREFAGQILGRSMIPPFEPNQQYWINQAQGWIKRSNLKVYVPKPFGRSGLSPAGTGLLKIIQVHSNWVTSVAASQDGSFIVTYDFI